MPLGCRTGGHHDGAGRLARGLQAAAQARAAEYAANASPAAW